MVCRILTALVLVLGLSGCAYDGGFTDDYVGGGYGWYPSGPLYGYGVSYGSAHRYGNPFYSRSSCYVPYYCPPYLASGYSFYGRPYGFVGPDDRLKRERKLRKKELKRERKLQKKAFKQDRKLQKRR